MDKALDLPEARTIVGLFLTRRDVIIFNRVSKAWNASVAYMLWHNVDIRHFRSFPSRGATLEQTQIPISDSTIRQNGHTIFNLCYQDHVSSQYQILAQVCSHLAILHAAIAGVEMPNTVAPLLIQEPHTTKKLRFEPWHACATLALQNQRTLTRLELGSIVVPRPFFFLPSGLLKSLAQGTGLTSLKLVLWLTTPVTLDSLLESLINLNTFHNGYLFSWKSLQTKREVEEESRSSKVMTTTTTSFRDRVTIRTQPWPLSPFCHKSKTHR